jgi:hypothetical protein
MQTFLRGLSSMPYGQVSIVQSIKKKGINKLEYDNRGLMDKDDMGNLGFADLHRQKRTDIDDTSNPKTPAAS